MAKQAIPASQLAESWSNGFTPQAAAKLKSKIAAYQGNPMALAATDTAMNKFLQAVQDSVSSGRRRDALNAADVNVWKTNTQDTTAWMNSRNKGKAKYMKKMEKMSAVYAQASAAAEAVQGTSAKVMASINTMRAAVGKPPLA